VCVHWFSVSDDCVQLFLRAMSCCLDYLQGKCVQKIRNAMFLYAWNCVYVGIMYVCVLCVCMYVRIIYLYVYVCVCIVCMYVCIIYL